LVLVPGPVWQLAQRQQVQRQQVLVLQQMVQVVQRPLQELVALMALA
jgi:hypothetical protein